MKFIALRLNKLSQYLILVFILLITIPWVVLSYQTFEETKQEYLKQVALRLNVLAIDRERITRLMIEARQRSLHVLAHEPATKALAADLAAGQDGLESEYLHTVLRRNPYFEGIVVVDLKSGRYAVAGNFPPALITQIVPKLTRHEETAYIIEARQKGAPIFLLGQYLDETMPGARPDKAILAVANTKFLKDLYRDISSLGETGESFMSDNRGRPLTPLRYPQYGGHTSQALHADAIKDCLRGNVRAFMITPDYVDAPTVMSFRPVKGYGGCVMVHMRASEVFSPVNALKQKILLFNVTEGLIVLGIAGIVARKMLQTEKQLHRLATTDALTGVSNRLLLMELLEMELNRFKRFPQTSCLLMLDIDHFKFINDTYGHAKGDWVLKHFSTTIANNLRDSDVFGRFGGEEFCIMLPDTEIDGAQQFAERLCQIITATPANMDDTSIAYSVSIGVTAFLPDDIRLDHIIERADAALYQAKIGGRNRAVSA